MWLPLACLTKPNAEKRNRKVIYPRGVVWCGHTDYETSNDLISLCENAISNHDTGSIVLYHLNHLDLVSTPPVELALSIWPSELQQLS